MPLPFFLALCAFTLSLSLTPLLRNLAFARGWLDRPDQHRKRHASAVPRIGGIPILLAYVGCFGIFFLLNPHQGLDPEFSHVWRFFPAGALVFLVGLADDFVGLKPWQKLLGQAAAAALACVSGIQIEGVAGISLNHYLVIPVTMLWLIACTNAFNLIDGMDGLASGLGLLAALTALVAGLLNNDTGLILATAPLAGALLGFLVFNFNPASIFLGDCGSLWVGFMLACYGVVWSQKAVTALGVTAPLMALSIPLLDTVLSIVRRFLRHQPVFSGDHDHIHHRLLRRGFTPKRAVVLLYLAGTLAACFSIVQSSSFGYGRGILLSFFVAVWCGIQYLRYQEFGIAADWFRRHGLRSAIRSHVCLHSCEESLRAATTADECWTIVQSVGHELGFSQVTLLLGGDRYHELLKEPDSRHWMLHVPLSDTDYIRFMCPFERNSQTVIVGPLASVLRRCLSGKTAQIAIRANMPLLDRAVAAGQSIQ